MRCRRRYCAYVDSALTFYIFSQCTSLVDGYFDVIWDLVKQEVVGVCVDINGIQCKGEDRTE